MKKILIFNILLLCSMPLLKAQDEQEDNYANAAEQVYDEPQAEEQTQESLDADSSVQPIDVADAAPMIVIDTFMPVRKSFIRRANIIFRDRERLKYENDRLRAEIAELNKDITKKNKQVKELTDYVNNQTFALNEAKKTAAQKTEEAANLQSELDQLNQDLVRCQSAKIGWTIGGFLVGAGIGALVMLLVN